MTKKLFISIFLLLTFLAAGCSAAGTSSVQNAAVEKTTLKIGSLPRIFDVVLYVAQQEGIFEKNNIEVEIVPFRSVVERNNAFLAGELDVFVDSMYEAININKELDYCKTVAHNVMPDMFEIVASPQSGITSVSQLTGKDIAMSSATIMEYALDTLLAQEGIDPAETNYVNVPNMPLRLEMLAQGNIHAAILTPPLSKQAVYNGNILILDDSKRSLAGPAIIVSNDAIAQKSAAIADLIESWQQTVKLVNADPEKYRSILIETASVPEALAGEYEVPVFPELRLPSSGELNELVDWMKSKEMLTTGIAYDIIVDTQYLK